MKVPSVSIKPPQPSSGGEGVVGSGGDCVVGSGGDEVGASGSDDVVVSGEDAGLNNNLGNY